MDLEKFVIAMGIMLISCMFFTNLISTIYPAPKLDVSGCYPVYNNTQKNQEDCYSLADTICGSDLNCSINAEYYGDQRFIDCQNQQNLKEQKCISDQTRSMQNYNFIYYIILSVFSLTLLIAGVKLIRRVTLGSGLIGAGIMMVVFSSFFSAMNSIFSMVNGGFSSMFFGGLANGEVSFAMKVLPYLNLVVLFIALVILITFTYNKIDKNSNKR